MIVRALYSLLTIYMLLILLRWLGPWVQVHLDEGRLRPLCRLTDPLIDAMRRILPPMGPMDFGPVAALLAVYLLRTLSVAILIGAST